jgi:acetolactate synthase-1/3 small subunit
MVKQEFIITVYTENSLGLLSRITIMFSRRRINIESLNVAASEIKGIHRFTIIVSESEDIIQKLVLQIEKQVEVLKSFYHTNAEVVWKEQALYKISGSAALLLEAEKRFKEYGGRVIGSEADTYRIFETTGSPEITAEILKELEPFGLTEFVRSARVAIDKCENSLHQRLKQFESIYSNKHKQIQCE